jgi:hypothetical protein
MLTTLQTATLDRFGANHDTYANALRLAGKLFDRAYSQGQRAHWLAKVTGLNVHLAHLPRRAEAAHRTTRTVFVPLDSIVGSEGRSDDFDAAFHPLKLHNRERWLSVAAAHLTGVVLPAVELVQVGAEFYVRDGHHRISVARALGQAEVEARIVN